MCLKVWPSPSMGPQHIVDDYEIPPYWSRMVGIDWGYRKPFCALWAAQNPQTYQWVVYDEIYAAGMTDEEQARAVRAKSEGQFIRFYFADPSMWRVQTQSLLSIASTADIYKANGIYLQRADNDRLSGKKKVDRLLLNTTYKEPGLVFQKKCKNTYRTMMSLPYDKDKRGEDVDTRAEDHPFDALKYLLTTARGVQLVEKAQMETASSVHPLYAAFQRRKQLWH